MPTVTVFTPTQGKRPEMLNQAILSVRNQTVKALEHIIELDRGEGQVQTMNRAMSKAKGDFFIFLADDDMLDRLFIEKTLAEAKKTGVDIVATFLKSFGDQQGVHGPNRFPFGTALCKTKFWKEVGGYDETVGVACDADFWFACFDRGAKWTIISDPLFLNRVHGDQYTHRADWEQSRKRIKEKYHGKYD